MKPLDYRDRIEEAIEVCAVLMEESRSLSALSGTINTHHYGHVNCKALLLVIEKLRIKRRDECEHRIDQLLFSLLPPVENRDEIDF